MELAFAIVLTVVMDKTFLLGLVSVFSMLLIVFLLLLSLLDHLSVLQNIEKLGLLATSGFFSFLTHGSLLSYPTSYL